MAKAGIIEIDLAANTARFQSDMSKATRALNSNVSQMNKSLRSLQSAFKSVQGMVGGTVAAMAAFAATNSIVNFGKDAVKAFNEAEDSAKRLSTALQTSGRLSAQAMKIIQDSAASIQRTTTQEDDAVTAATATFANFAKTLNAPELAQAQKAIVGLATVMKTDLDTAAKQLGKTVSGASNTIGRTGIEISNTANQSKRLNEVLQKTNGFFQTAQGLAGTEAGRIAQLKNVFGDLMEVIGEIVSDSVDLGNALGPGGLAGFVVRLTEDLNKNKQQIVENIKSFIQMSAALVDAGMQVGKLAVLLVDLGLRLVGVNSNLSGMFSTLNGGQNLLRDTAMLASAAADGFDTMGSHAQIAVNNITRSFQLLDNLRQYGGGSLFGGNEKLLEMTNASANKKAYMANRAIIENTLAAYKRRAEYRKSLIGQAVLASTSSYSPTNKNAGNGAGKGGKKGGKSEAEKEYERLKSEAKAIKERNRTIFEIEKEGMERLKFLRSKNLVDMETYRRESARLNKELMDAIKIPTEDIEAATNKVFEPFKKLTEEMENGVKTSDVFNDKLSQSRELLESLKTPLELYNEKVQQYADLLREGFIPNQEVFNSLVSKAQEEFISAQEQAKGTTERFQLLAGALSNVGTKIEDAFVTSLLKGKVSFKDFALSIVEDLTRLIFKLTITIPLVNALTKAFDNQRRASTLKLLGGNPVLSLGTSLFGGILSAAGGGGLLSAGSNALSLLPGRASGGPVSSGRPYIVGERGPELFVPGQSGMIHPNGSGSSVLIQNTFNLSAGDPKQNDDLSKKIAAELQKQARAAVNDELRIQKRPGGQLYAGAF